jgi:hypothetical protein
MATAVYVLCALTSLVCAWLLLRGYLASQARLLLWSGLCFVGLTLNNLVLFLDKVVITDIDLTLGRLGTALAGLLILLYGLIWETD